MDILTKDDVARALPWTELVDRLDRAFTGGIETPPRHHHAVHRADGEATMLLMPAWEDADQSPGYLGVKMVNVFPQNADKDLPAISGVYLLSDGATGQPLACIDGSELTRRRTAAASALAARYLARKNAETLVVVGTGKLAPMLIEAHAAVRPIRNVVVYGRNLDKARALAADYVGYSGGQVPLASVKATEDLASAVAGADIVSAATLSTQPIIRGEWLRPGTHVDLVGAFRPDMRETDSACVEKAEVFVDSHAGARGEAGDLHHAVNEGRFDMGAIKAELSELANGAHPGRTRDDAISLFKSVGVSLEDLAAAILVWENHAAR
ncbi:bifunctional Delta(1)-pyrroline-2-carboxylate/Delta(1)-piperideine-2-carboxylate reductase [Marinobacter mangrovi]|uniref:ornithine cyclodeaminase family protein n=1 Tax=Marinobacter mangrovi TaxID=2803918 RepID=UPI0019341A51|nr:ornithine cyclodeaminase family protein [Marinobacter mangrovi]